MKNLLAIFVTLFCVSALQASEGHNHDPRKSVLRAVLPDTVQPDSSLPAGKFISDTSAARDTTLKADSTATSSGIDTVVTYSAADSIVYSIANREMKLYQKGKMEYRDFKLDAGHIAINWDNAVLTAEGTKDTADKIVEEPVFTQGGETYNGSDVAYDFRTKKGTIKVANTTIDKGRYHGQLIKKYSKDVLYIQNGRFTTCDKNPPDYYFQSSRMKLIVGNEIIAEPIVMYIDGVPVFALPFGVFPAKSGRRSGIITPSFGESANYGRYLSHFGYFWAINNYADLTTTADWWTRGKYDINTGLRYDVRYEFQGSIYGSYAYQADGQPGDPGRVVSTNWNLQMTHQQSIDPNTQLTANVSMASQNYYTATSLDYARLLNNSQNLVSNVTLSHTWQGSGNAITINLHRDQNLQDGSITANLPDISFSHSQSYPFRTAADANKPLDQLAWYKLIGFSYNGTFENNISKLSTSDSTYDRFSTYGANHSISINASPKVGYFTFSPYVSISDKMYPSRTILTDVAGSTGQDSLVAEKQRGFYNIGYFSTGLTASTRIYGLASPHIFGITAFRHTLQPSVTVSYQPDFSRPFWGYYGHYYTLNDSQVTYDYYGSRPYIYGGAPQGEFGGMSFALNNNFEAKIKSSDTSKTEQKIQLLNLGLSMSYNFLATGYNLPLSPLTVTYRTDIAGKINIGGSSQFNFYKYDYAAQRRVNRLLLADGQLPDMTSFSLSLSTAFHGQRKERSGSNQQQEQQSQDSTQAQQRYNMFYQQMQPPDLSIPWNLNLSFNFGISKPTPVYVSKTASLQFNLGFNLTQNWKIGFTGGYDFLQHDLVVPAVTVYRDLDCWEMTLAWNPIGYLRGFNLEIRIKAPQLRDIKITKREYQNIGF